MHRSLAGRNRNFLGCACPRSSGCCVAHHGRPDHNRSLPSFIVTAWSRFRVAVLQLDERIRQEVRDISHLRQRIVSKNERSRTRSASGRSHRSRSTASSFFRPWKQCIVSGALNQRLLVSYAGLTGSPEFSGASVDGVQRTNRSSSQRHLSARLLRHKIAASSAAANAERRS
jgi:hypothetical protein